MFCIRGRVDYICSQYTKLICIAVNVAMCGSTERRKDFSLSFCFSFVLFVFMLLKSIFTLIITIHIVFKIISYIVAAVMMNGHLCA